MVTVQVSSTGKQLAALEAARLRRRPKCLNGEINAECRNEDCSIFELWPFVNEATVSTRSTLYRPGLWKAPDISPGADIGGIARGKERVPIGAHPPLNPTRPPRLACTGAHRSARNKTFRAAEPVNENETVGCRV